jgi:hypothetical protein
MWTVASFFCLQGKSWRWNWVFGQLLFSGKAVSFSSLPVSSKMVKCVLIFLRLWLGPPLSANARSAQYSLQSREGEIFSPFIKTSILSGRGTTCFQAALDYVVSSTAHGAAHSPGGVIVSLGGIRSHPGSTLVSTGKQQLAVLCQQNFIKLI